MFRTIPEQGECLSLTQEAFHKIESQYQGLIKYY